MAPCPKSKIQLTKTKWDRLVQEVFERDNFVCQMPTPHKDCTRGQRDQLIPHHIIPKSRIRLDIRENILTICSTCHVKLHNNELKTSVNDLIDQHGLLGRY